MAALTEINLGCTNTEKCFNSVLTEYQGPTGGALTSCAAEDRVMLHKKILESLHEALQSISHI